MNEFLGLLKNFKENDVEFLAGINGKEVVAKVSDINGDLVTLIGDDGSRYDLYYTQIVVCSALKSVPGTKAKRGSK